MQRAMVGKPSPLRPSGQAQNSIPPPPNQPPPLAHAHMPSGVPLTGAVPFPSTPVFPRRPFRINLRLLPPPILRLK